MHSAYSFTPVNKDGCIEVSYLHYPSHQHFKHTSKSLTTQANKQIKATWRFSCMKFTRKSSSFVG
ncbi:expressed protein [Echinococcus multilocularis]|uniref:Expressed protein n=1 Tax=Echinococcus multilocularis TaxID=6211 RepID=A0A087VY41_ECHMU|nr:expressed protein [Echinococcus multilocularis]